MGRDTVQVKTFKFVNNLDCDLYAAVHHVGCAGVPWRGALPMCWSQDIKKKSDASYEPSAWVTKFELWAEIIGAGVGGGIAIAVTLGAATPAVAVAAGEVAGAVELTDFAASSVELTEVATTSVTGQVLKIIGAKAVGVATGALLSELMAGWGAYVRPQNWADVREPQQLYIHKGEFMVVVPDLQTAEDPSYFKKV